MALPLRFGGLRCAPDSPSDTRMDGRAPNPPYDRQAGFGTAVLAALPLS
jgi:hypothetical protein